MPFMPGILTSSRMMSAGSSRARRTPSSPELTEATTCDAAALQQLLDALAHQRVVVDQQHAHVSLAPLRRAPAGRRRVEHQHDARALAGLALDHDLARQPLGALAHDREARMLARHALGDCPAMPRPSSSISTVYRSSSLLSMMRTLRAPLCLRMLVSASWMM